MKRDDETAEVILNYAEYGAGKENGGPGMANVKGYGLIDGRGGRLAICLTHAEYDNEGSRPEDLSALTESREQAFTWLCGEPFVSKLRTALASFDEAERLAQTTGDLNPALAAADEVIELARAWADPAEELLAWTIDVEGEK